VKVKTKIKTDDRRGYGGGKGETYRLTGGRTADGWFSREKKGRRPLIAWGYAI